jgi:predicted nucleic-acid-binding protein
MIGLDTNVLARYYIEDDSDAQAQRQRLAAQRLIESGRPLMVCKTVLLELEWVMRGYYGFAPTQAASVLRHLLELPHVTVEDRDTVDQALSNFDAGIDFADALHHASYRACSSVASFDDRKFAKRGKKLGLAPAVVVLS